MAQDSFAQWLSELKDKNDIVSVVSSYVPLTRKGRHHWGCCPFHNEKTPSFSVNEELQIYKCFGCGAAGDVIKFVQEKERTDFNGAIRILADRAGMEIPNFGKADTQADKKRNELFAIMNAAQEYFVKNLKAPNAKAANDYIAKRGLSKKVIEDFGLGFAPPGWENLKTYLLGLGFKLETIKETGLLTENSKDKCYDKFRNRIMYPIVDEKGNIISFGGRIIDPEDQPKYMNCPQTLLYNKSNTLYGLNIAKNHARGMGSLIIVEGYMDVISMHEFGYSTAVASCGTSLTQQQARKIKRYVNKVYIGYDGDGAGQKATIRGLDILKNTGLEVFVLSFPDGCDPDDTLRKYGKDYFDDIIKNAKNLEEFKIEKIFASSDLSTNEGKVNAARSAMEIASNVELDIEREKYIDYIAQKTGYSQRAVLNDVNRMSGKKTTVDVIKTAPLTYDTKTVRTPQKNNKLGKNKDFAAESKLVCLMMRDGNIAREALETINSTCFSDEMCKNMINAMQAVLENEVPFEVGNVMQNFKGDEKLISDAYGLLMSEIKTYDLKGETLAYAKKVKAQYYTRRSDEMKAQANLMIAQGKISDDECQRLISEMKRYKTLAKDELSKL